MKNHLAASVMLLASAPAITQAQYQEWNSSRGGNGHYYEAVSAATPVTWSQAFSEAQRRGGYLATISSAEENAFVFSLIDAPEYWIRHPQGNSMGPWLGGFQSSGAAEPSGGWQWVGGEGSFNYSNWYSNEPNNYCGYMNTCEDRLQFFGAGDYGRSAYWNDIPGELDLVRAYVVEYNAAPVPEADSWMLLVAGLALLACRSRLASKQERNSNQQEQQWTDHDF